MLTFSLGARIFAIGAAAVTVAFVLLGNDRSVGFGVVRESQSVDAPKAAAELPERLNKLRAALAIEPAQEAAWGLFESRVVDLDQVSRRIETEGDRRGANVANERAQHALLFTVALSEMDQALSSTQSSTLQREARVIGSTFICADVRPQGS